MMGSAYVDPAYIDRLHDDIKIACQRLEEHGHESLVVTVKDTNHEIIGSQIGINFLEVKLVVDDFKQFCFVSKHRVKQEAIEATVPAKKSPQVRSTNTSDQANIPDSLSTSLQTINNNGDDDDDNENQLFDDDTDDYDDGEDYTEMLNDVSNGVEDDVAQRPENRDKTDKALAGSLGSDATGDKSRLAAKGETKSTDYVMKRMPDVRIVLTKLEDDKVNHKTTPSKTVARSAKAKKAKEKDSVTEEKAVSDNNEEIVKAEVPFEPKVPKEIKAEQTPSGQYRCSHCYQFLSSKDHITQHIQAHMAFACEWCGKLCRSFEFLEKHKNRGCSKHLYNFHCKRCEDKFSSELDLRVHIEQVHENMLEKDRGTFECSKCKTVFNYEGHLSEHNQRIPDCDKIIKTPDSGKKKKDLDQEISYTNPDTGETKVTTLGKLLEKTKNKDKRCKITCDLCGKHYEFKSSYQRHVSFHSEIKLIPCNICGTNFTNMDNFRKHIKRHEVRPYYCPTCFSRFDSKILLDNHMAQKCVRYPTKEELFCKDCGYQSSNRSSYKQHRRLHHNEILEHCSTCGESFKRKTYLQRHMKLVHGTDVEIKCEKCDKKFLSYKNLRGHMKTHGVPTYECEKCDYRTTLRKNLSGHMRTHSRDKPYVCEKCGKSFGTKYYLTTHYRMHTGEKPYLCDFPECGKGFRNSEQLKAHKLRHSDKCGFVCDFCGRGFKQRSELSHHRLYHIIEHRWPCEYCDEKFKMLKYYKNHIVKKHPEKAEEVEKKRSCLFYRCTMCTKMFAKREHWVEHENYHKGHKPWKCQYCEKDFCSKGNLRQHERSHTGTNNKKCALCSRSYSDIEMLKKHLKVKHDLSEQMAEIKVEEAKLKVRAKLTVRPVSSRTKVHTTQGQGRGREEVEQIEEDDLPEDGVIVPLLAERMELQTRDEDLASSLRLQQIQQQYIILDQGNRFPNLPPFQE